MLINNYIINIKINLTNNFVINKKYNVLIVLIVSIVFTLLHSACALVAGTVALRA